MKSIRADYSNSVMWALFNKKNGTILKTNGKPVVLSSRNVARGISHLYPAYVIDKVYVDIERITS